MFDIIIIGGGPGGYVAAIRAAQKQKKVLLIEAEHVGGTCLNIGCIPTKTLLHASNLYATLRKSNEIGITAQSVEINIEQMYGYKDSVILKLRNGIEQLLKQNKVTVIKGTAQFVNSTTVKVEENVYSGEHIIVATGSRPFRPPFIEGIEHAQTSNEILAQARQYESVIIIGGGVIGVEFATYYAELGKSVTIIELCERILPIFDADLSQQLALTLKKKGVKVITAAKVLKVEKADGEKTVVHYAQKEQQLSVTADTAIVCIGRIPNVDRLNFKEIGIDYSNKGVTVNADFQTSVPNIYAIGDINGQQQLAHVASAQGIAAVDHICRTTRHINLNVIPSCIYSHPEIAVVGLTEEQAKIQNIGVKVGKFPVGANGKSVISGHLIGFVKVLFDEKTDTMVGATLFCEHATDMISEFAVSIVNGIKRTDFLSTVHPHPTVAESLYEAVEDVAGMAIHLLPKNV